MKRAIFLLLLTLCTSLSADNSVEKVEPLVVQEIESTQVQQESTTVDTSSTAAVGAVVNSESEKEEVGFISKATASMDKIIGKIT